MLMDFVNPFLFGTKGYLCQCTYQAYKHSIFSLTVSSKCLFSNLLKQIKFSYGPFWQSNIHSTLDVCPRPDQPGRKQMYHYKIEAKILLCIQVSLSSWVKIICKDDKEKKKFQLRSRQVLASFHQELLDILSF